MRAVRQSWLAGRTPSSPLALYRNPLLGSREAGRGGGGGVEASDAQGQRLRGPHHIQGHALPHGPPPSGSSLKVEGKYRLSNS